MTFLRSLFLNFLIVFFVDRVIPGIQIVNYEGVPDVINDVLFASVVAFLNASIYPAFYIAGVKATTLAMGICAFIISFGSFLLIYFVDVGVSAESFFGVILGTIIVGSMSLFTNILEKKHMHFKD